MSKRMTIAFEVEDSNSEMLDELFESFKEQENVGGLKVYAMSHNCLFEQIEDIEDILDRTFDEDKLADIAYVIEGGL